MTDIRPKPGILEIAPYVGGASHVEGVADVVKLSSNENPFGPSESAKEALRRTAHNLHRYPPSDHAELRRAIGEMHTLDPERIICGAGSDEILAFLCQAYAGAGDQVIHTEHGFALYRICALVAGATPVEVPETERRVDVDEILEACNFRTKLVFIANPANPTGTMLGTNELARLADGKAAPAQEASRVAATGCPYKNRCPSVMPRCQGEMPPAYPIHGGGVANCFLHAPDAAHQAGRSKSEDHVAS